MLSDGMVLIHHVSFELKRDDTKPSRGLPPQAIFSRFTFLGHGKMRKMLRFLNDAIVHSVQHSEMCTTIFLKTILESFSITSM